MQPPLPSATATWHNDTYSAILPTRPELTATGKTVLITGAGTGIGRETAIAFAAAGASKVILLGRSEVSLTATAAALPASSKVAIYIADVANEEAIQQAAASVGTWDILVLAAGHCAAPASITQSSTDEWWKSFETNVKGTMLSIKTFVPTANQTHATIIGIMSCSATFPSFMVPGLSALSTSKLALAKLIEFVAAENPNIFAATIHPGMVETSIFTKSGSKAESLPMDNVKLPAHFMVWLASPEAAFLRGRSVWANWDVEELKAQGPDIQAGRKMTCGVHGWPV